MLISATYAKNDSLSLRCKKTIFFTSAGSLYTGSLIALGSTWYKKYDKASFHWFNDNSEWLQMDKAGHSFTAWRLNILLYEGFTFSGYTKKQSVLYSWIGSNVAMASIEFFDGMSAKWGASWGDLIVNMSGATAFSLQKYYCNKTWVLPKFSFSRTEFYSYYPDALGNSLPENILKDYNGQTYWLSFPVKRFYQPSPEWLCLSFGYGANSMIGGKDNTVNGIPVDVPERYRQYYFSLDVDLSQIKTKSTFLRMCFKTFNVLKFPFPALELSNGKLKTHALYY